MNNQKTEKRADRPNWTPLELLDHSRRTNDLAYETADHEPDCLCNLCMEFFSLNHFTAMFSMDEHAEAARASWTRVEL